MKQIVHDLAVLPESVACAVDYSTMPIIVPVVDSEQSLVSLKYLADESDCIVETEDGRIIVAAHKYLTQKIKDNAICQTI